MNFDYHKKILFHISGYPSDFAFFSRNDKMSVSDVNKRKMMHRAVNTDPLQLAANEETQPKHYGLKTRNIHHIKINEMKELNVWYDIGERIGEGSFGMVLEVFEKGTDKVWAMKTVSKSTAGDRLILVQREIQVLKLIDHPHIIYLDKIFESSKHMYMIFEKCHDFVDIYHKRKPFPENIAKKIFSELVDAVAYLHKYDIVHRDLKIENILLGQNPADPNDEYYIKLTDFGLSVCKTVKGVDSMLHEYCGTLTYMAPEVITLRNYSQTCDMWSVGVILYMLVVGKFPFYSKNEKELQLLICTKKPTFTDPKLSQEVKDLILLLLVKEPVNRIRATEALHHPWFLDKKMSRTLHYNILEKMKEWKSEMRVETGSASDWVVPPPETVEVRRSISKQPLNLPKTNISFDRGRRLSSKSGKTGTKDDFSKRKPSGAF